MSSLFSWHMMHLSLSVILYLCFCLFVQIVPVITLFIKFANFEFLLGSDSSSGLLVENALRLGWFVHHVAFSSL